jgi:hypothetical protein
VALKNEKKKMTGLNFILTDGGFSVHILHCIVLQCTVLHCIALYCIVLYCIVLHCIAIALYPLERNVISNGMFVLELCHRSRLLNEAKSVLNERPAGREVGVHRRMNFNVTL